MKSKTAAVVLSLCGVLFVFSSTLKADEGKKGTAGDLIEGFPAACAVDGSLSEWTMPPSVTLTAANQVAGKDRAKGDKDFRASVWVAVSTGGALIAGKVEDDAYLPPAADKDILNSDHFEFWLSFRGSEMPPLAYVNQFGEHVVEGDAEARKNINENNNQWVNLQLKRRGILKRAFTRQYIISAAGLSEAYWAGVADIPIRKRLTDDPYSRESSTITYAFLAPTAALQQYGKSVFRKTGDGYEFEAFIPADAFPDTVEHPLTGVSFLIDAVDNDRGHGRQEKFFSSSAGRAFGKSETFNQAILKAPLSFSGPAGSFALLQSSGCFYSPGSDMRMTYAFANVGRGYQYEPDEPSPDVVPLKMPVKPLLEYNGLALFEVPVAVNDLGRAQYLLAAVRGGKILSTYGYRTRCADGVSAAANNEHAVIAPQIILKRGDAIHVLLQKDTTKATLGNGQGGSCPALVYEVLEIDENGGMKCLADADIYSDSGAGVQLEPGKGDSGYLFMVSYDKEVFGKDSELHHFKYERRYSWDEASGSYHCDTTQEEMKEE